MSAYILKERKNLYTISCEQAFSEHFTTRLCSRHINVKEMTAVLHILQR